MSTSTVTTTQAFELALQHHQAGRLKDAEPLYRQILAVQPDHADALHLLGVVHLQTGRFEEAVEWISRSLQIFPRGAAAYSNLGVAHREMGCLEKAAANYQRAIELKPDYVEAHFNLGSILNSIGRVDEAIETYRRIIALHPDYAKAHLNLGNIFRRRGNLAEAIPAYRRAVEFAPGAPEMHCNLAVALAEDGQVDEAIAASRRALELRPDFAEAHNNLGIALTEGGHYEEALAAYRRALELQPNLPEARFGLGIVQMLLGDFSPAWPLLEARLEVYGIPRRQFPCPEWDGRLLEGKRVLIHAEQGFGDSIQFIRYAELIAARGGEVVVECPRPLVALFHRAKGVREIIASGDPLPPFDTHLAMLTQPLAFQTTIESIPSTVPYLFAEPARREAWQVRLATTSPRRKVGLVWAGSPQNPRTRLRDIPFEALLPLFTVDEVEFFSLQCQRPASQIPQLQCPSRLIDHTSLLHDFADTAALIAELDLVISADTAVAHLAGALGRPVWSLLPFVPDWRWGLDCETTPWYPTMRLFRQTSPGDWTSVIRRVTAELRRLPDSAAL